MKSLVSIVIPTYNGAEFISDTINSVLGQTYKTIEVIVVNDGSTDNTLEVLSIFGDKIRVITQDNSGLSNARNKGIENASGDWIAFLDSDDLWYPDKLDCQMNKLKNNKNCRWVYCDAEYFDSETKETKGLLSDFSKPHKGWVLKELFMANFISTPTPVIAREVFEITGGFYSEKKVPEDWDMWLRIASIFPVCHVNMPLAKYRVHASSMSRKTSFIKNQPYRCEVALERILKTNPELIDYKNKSLSNVYTATGKTFLRNNDYKSGLESFCKAINLTPTDLNLYFFLLLSFFGKPIIPFLIKIKDIHRAKRFKQN